MIVSYETSLLAQEKGFDIPCRNYSVKQQESSHEHPYEGFEDDYWGDNRIVNWNKQDIGIKPFKGLVSRPLQYELQKWLREVHGYHVQPQKTFHNTTYKIGKVPYVLIDDESDGHPRSYMTPSKKSFKTYEEALEFGMKHILEFIKIV